MAIKASSSQHIDALIADLSNGSEVRRETAVARLTVIGVRAVDRLIDRATSDADAGARAAALRALDGIGDARALPAAVRAIGDADEGVALSAIAVTRAFLRGPKGADALDPLTALAVDTRKPGAVRAAAIAALREGLDGDPKALAPLLKSLSVDRNATVRAAAAGAPQIAADERRSNDAPASVREWLGREGGKAPLSSVLAMVERVAEREAAASATARAEWKAVRFAAHLVLARRGSRIALYDLRESLEKADTPLPVDALAALALVGDTSCLEPIASAFARSKDRWWRDHLLEAFQAIAKREKLTPRHAAIKKIQKKFGI